MMMMMMKWSALRECEGAPTLACGHGGARDHPNFNRQDDFSINCNRAAGERECGYTKEEGRLSSGTYQ